MNKKKEINESQTRKGDNGKEKVKKRKQNIDLNEKGDEDRREGKFIDEREDKKGNEDTKEGKNKHEENYKKEEKNK